LKAIEAQLARATREREQWDAAYASEAISLDEFVRHRNEYKQATDALRKRQAQIQGRLTAMQTTRDAVVTLQETVDVIDDLTGKELNELYRQLIDRVVVNTDGTIKLILL
ncbi:MAG: hypothetical protein JXA74_13460, partial [Anaerolineae bacterium]|nr:hypothetical protein [Anaerolineae bacterium]